MQTHRSKTSAPSTQKHVHSLVLLNSLIVIKTAEQRTIT